MNTLLNIERKISLSTYILIAFCFFLPFIEISCMGIKVFSVTGNQIITDTIKDINGENKAIRPFIEQNGKPSLRLRLIVTFGLLIVAMLITLFYSDNYRNILLVIFGILILAVFGSSILEVEMEIKNASNSDQKIGMTIQICHGIGVWLIFGLTTIISIFNFYVAKVRSKLKKST